jgi:hypothetical protein
MNIRSRQAATPSFPRRRESSDGPTKVASWISTCAHCRLEYASCHNNAAGSRPGGRVTFLLYDKKVTKETYPATSALRATRCFEARNGRSRKLACGSDTRSRTAPFPASHHRLGGRGVKDVSRPSRLRLAIVSREDRQAVAPSLCELLNSHQSRRARKTRRGQSGGACLSGAAASLRNRPSEAFAARAARRAGEAGAASLPTFLQKQESRSPAGAKSRRRDRYAAFPCSTDDRSLRSPFDTSGRTEDGKNKHHSVAVLRLRRYAPTLRTNGWG